jgi:putative membrane protein
LDIFVLLKTIFCFFPLFLITFQSTGYFQLLYLKALHIIFVVTWFAGLFYIVRLFIYQTEANSKHEPDLSILVNEYRKTSRRLWYMITWPSAVLTLIFGLTMLQLYPVWPTWLFLKLSLVALLYIYHFMCQRLYSELQRGRYPATSFQLRIWNEIATILLVSIVFLVVLKSALDMTYGLIGLVIFGVVLISAIHIYKKIRQ